MIKTTIEHNVGWITLNDPRRLNALSYPLLSELENALNDLAESEDVRCLVINAAGNSFCVGGDLIGFKDDVQKGGALLHDRLAYAQKVFNILEAFPFPTIAAVQGHAVAGGLELILCCDMVVATRSAVIGDGHAKYGIIPGGGSSVRLPAKIPANRAHYLLYSGELVGAPKLADWGLINNLVNDDELTSEVQALASQIARNSRPGLQATKRLVNSNRALSTQEGLDNELSAFETYQHTAEFLEGLSAFQEKRRPDFR